ncbi:MAG: thymidylate kinase [Oscillospiraceae bacterium]|nr:thymidylate kinase [Oscillospiraceae bacterium]
MSGKLIVLEGADGAGKTTQAGLMVRRLEGEGVPFRQVKFPRYGSPFAAPVERYLQGDLGKKPGDVSAYAASTLYAVDRYASFRQDWREDYEGGKVILTDRYTTSNAVHQAPKLPEGERQPYLDWLFDLEYSRLALPEPDLVIYLDLPAEIAARMLRLREEATHTRADIHEQDGAYLRACQESAREIADRLGWRRVDCSREGALRTPEDIHRELWELVRPLIGK